MRIETRKAYSSSEVGLFSLPHRVFVAVKMLLSQSEINDKHLFKILGEDKVRGFNVPMDEIPVVDLLDCLEHLDQELDSDLEAVIVFEDLSDFS